MSRISSSSLLAGVDLRRTRSEMDLLIKGGHGPGGGVGTHGPGSLPDGGEFYTAIGPDGNSANSFYNVQYLANFCRFLFQARRSFFGAI